MENIRHGRWYVNIEYHRHRRGTTVCASGQVKTLAISPNATSAVIGFSTGTVSVFDVRSGGIQGTLKVPEGEVLKVILRASLHFEHHQMCSGEFLQSQSILHQFSRWFHLPLEYQRARAS